MHNLRAGQRKVEGIRWATVTQGFFLFHIVAPYFAFFRLFTAKNPKNRRNRPLTRATHLNSPTRFRAGFWSLKFGTF